MSGVEQTTDLAALEKAAPWRPGDRVYWGWGCDGSLAGTLICVARDEDTGEVEMCGEEHPDGPGVLWRIRFDDGREKLRCCEKAIVGRATAPSPPPPASA